jgi:hypothetical protein
MPPKKKKTKKKSSRESDKKRDDDRRDLADDVDGLADDFFDDEPREHIHLDDKLFHDDESMRFQHVVNTLGVPWTHVCIGTLKLTIRSLNLS